MGLYELGHLKLIFLDTGIAIGNTVLSGKIQNSDSGSC